MAQQIKTGTVMIKERALLPESLQFESEPYSSGWESIQHLDAYGLDRKIREAGWTFFSVAGQLKATVLGSAGEKTVLRAIKGIIAKLKSEPFNCFEITEVMDGHFLGIPYVHVCAHQRHIQEGPFLLRPKKDLRERDRARLSAARERA